MTAMEAWSVVSKNLAELYGLRRSVSGQGYDGADTMAEVISFQALQEMEEREKNLPLTLKDLKTMEGEPVWVQVVDNKKICMPKR